MTHPELLGLLPFAAGVIFYAGMLTAKLSALTHRMSKLEDCYGQILGLLNELRDLVRDEED